MFFWLTKCLAQAILSGRHKPQCLGSKIKKVRHVDIINIQLMWCWFTCEQKYLFIYEMLSSNKSTMSHFWPSNHQLWKQNRLFTLLMCNVCRAVNACRFTVIISEMLSLSSPQSQQPLTLHKLISLHSWQSIVFPMGFDAHYINQTVHTFWWSDLCLYVFHSWFKYFLQRKTSCYFSDNSWNPVQSLWRWGLNRIHHWMSLKNTITAPN